MSTRKRKDAELIRKLDPFHSMVPYIMPKRTEAEVSCKKEFDITKLVDFIEEYNKAEGHNLKLFHCICMAAAKTIYHRPKMNIFIAGKHFYQRKDISLSFVAKQKFADEAVETLMFLKTKPEMKIGDFSKFILGEVDKARKDGSNDLDGTMGFVGKMPRFVLVILFGFLKILEFFGYYPASLTKGDPNYSTVLLSNLGSIGADSCYHHLSNFGTCSIMITIGTMKKIKTLDDKGKVIEKTVVDMTFNFDERIADGFYFAKSLRYMSYLFEHPEFFLESVDTPFPEGLIN